MASTDSRQLMIDTAVRLFQERGYHATSWRGLINESGAPWGSVQHHFPGGKEQLGAAAISAGAELVAAMLQSCLDREPSTAAGVGRWFARAATALERSGYRGGCPIATVSLETASDSPLMREAARTSFGSWIEMIATSLGADGLDATSAHHLATSTVAAFEGALLLARVQQSTEPVLSAAARVVADIESALTA